MEKHERISIIIVNYNGADFLRSCLESVFLFTDKSVEVIVVDNTSVDASVAMVRNDFPQVKIIINQSNRGFAGGNNAGVDAATGNFMVLLNNDTIVTENWLSGLVEAMRNPSVGLVTSKVITDGVPEEFYAMNGTINYLGYNIMREFSDLSQVFFAAGTSVMFRKSEAPLPFPDEYFLYHEDVFLSWSMRLRRREVRMVQESVVYHRGSATTRRQASSFVTFYQERNRLLNCLLFFERATLLRLIPYFAADALTKMILSGVNKRKSFAGIMRGYWWAFIHRNWIGEKRMAIQRSRTVPDKDILALMSYKVIDSNSVVANILNACSRFYAAAVGLSYHV